jgi:hypothetical protein
MHQRKSQISSCVLAMVFLFLRPVVGWTTMARHAIEISNLSFGAKPPQPQRLASLQNNPSLLARWI